MNRNEITEFIRTISPDSNAFNLIENKFGSLSKDELRFCLLDCGIIPESYAHDSTSEKLWAKYSDVVLASALSHLGIESEVLRARGDSADVFGKTEGYTIIGDAKAFRLSRTAKNQKDYKVSALNDWRKQNTYACLVSPLYHYPSRASQIYSQAETQNVTLLSYMHLKFLLDFPCYESLKPLWEVASTLTPSNSAVEYWNAVDDIILDLTGQRRSILKQYKTEVKEKVTQLGHEGISFWQNIIKSYRNLSREQAVARLIKAEKIEAKIHAIKRCISKEISL